MQFGNRNVYNLLTILVIHLNQVFDLKVLEVRKAKGMSLVNLALAENDVDRNILAIESVDKLLSNMDPWCRSESPTPNFRMTLEKAKEQVAAEMSVIDIEA